MLLNLRFLAIFPIAFSAISIEGHAQTQSISAYGTLNELSIDAASERRNISNALFVGAGIAAVAGVGFHIEEEYEAASLLALGSAISLAGGVFARHYETEVEQVMARISAIDNTEEREQGARDALTNLAHQQRTHRYTAAFINASLSGYYFFFDDSDHDHAMVNGAFTLGSALAYLFVRSPVERAVMQLNQSSPIAQRTQAQPLEWQWSIASNGLGLQMRF